MKEDLLDNFIQVRSRTTASVIIPLFGFGKQVEENPLNEELLESILQQIHSSNYHLYIIFVGVKKKQTPAVWNLIISKMMGNNVTFVEVDKDAGYSEYIDRGINFALQNTNSQFILVHNPWVMIKDESIDEMISRVNRGDDAKVVSGFDVSKLIEPDLLKTFIYSTPFEEIGLSFNFLGMPRYVAETCKIDPRYRTHSYLERDLWQTTFSKGWKVVEAQRMPIYSFDFIWKIYERKEDIEADRKYFTAKWGFDANTKR